MASALSQPHQPAQGRPAQGLYDPRYEHDACGVGFVADLTGERRHDTVSRALTVLRNLDHRGAKGSDPDTGDGAGILTQIPDELFRAVCEFELPAPGHYAAGLVFLPAGPARAAAVAVIERLAAAEGLTVLGWRAVPHDLSHAGAGARAVLPELAQLFVAGLAGEAGLDLDRRAFCLRKRAEHDLERADCYFASLSAADHRVQGHADRPRSWRASTPTWPTRGTSPPWPWCTRGSPPTPSRPGRWPTPTGSWPTTGRSTPSAATATGCGPARRC